MSKKQYYVYEHPYVFVVLEHATGVVDAKLHGVYTTRQSAVGCKAKLEKKGVAKGYVCIRKKHIDGIVPRVLLQDHYKAGMTRILVDND
jgi:hypothetical protein